MPHCKDCGFYIKGTIASPGCRKKGTKTQAMNTACLDHKEKKHKTKPQLKAMTLDVGEDPALTDVREGRVKSFSGTEELFKDLDEEDQG